MKYRVPVTYDAPEGWAILHCLMGRLVPITIYIPIAKLTDSGGADR